ncbi:hypothetical protein [Zavarzinella formosa]|uniref:hypothetical protein n=1 Tax=Zavarzinella formosa TaxID=360055 RepID=UPI0002DF569E|nr:hypothetical protein [Zavarzinella formosa]
MVRKYLMFGALAAVVGFAGCSQSPPSVAEKSSHGDHHDKAMPAKIATEEQRTLFQTPGGLYTEADIAENKNAIPAVKYFGMKSEHTAEAKSGEKICPISETKANPKFTWVVGGSTYEFCCVPCIEEFVSKAKNTPGEIKPPDAYRKK